MNAVILPKYRVFAAFFGQNAVVLRFHKNIMIFLISTIWTLLCELKIIEHKNIYFSFASATKVCVLCYLLAEYVTVTS